MRTHIEHQEDAATTRTETLLHQAADFVPAETAPEGLATRALARWESTGRDCSPRLKRNFAPALGLALAGAALIALFTYPGSDLLHQLSDPISQQSATIVATVKRMSQPTLIPQYTQFPP